jgi:hypothetical protein
MDCPDFTYSQHLLAARLWSEVDPECKNIHTLYIDTNAKSVDGLDYWCHPDFVKPFQKFVKWFNSQHPDYSVSTLEAHEVLDFVYST